ncbi:MAG TPA: CYTH domain-containing protein [Patescibacteria group bacterium]|nr:CYTH domain-containing protein [Patescibacteria group bacterium]
MAKERKPAAASAEIEQEIKLRLPLRDLEQVFRALRKSAIEGKVRHQYLSRAYYDSRDLILYRHNISLRLQYKPGSDGRLGGYEQTVKFDLAPGVGATAGTFFRKECRDALTGAAPSLARISDPEARVRARHFRLKKMEHIFTAAVERRALELVIGRGKARGRVEIAFDVGEIILSTGKRYPFSEIEIEMIAGDSSALSRVAEKILKLAPKARLQSLSKAQQGSRLFQRNARA